MLPPDLKVIAFKGRMEFADQANQYLTEKELFLRQEKYKKQEAMRFKGQIKKWIALNIPQEWGSQVRGASVADEVSRDKQHPRQTHL